VAPNPATILEGAPSERTLCAYPYCAAQREHGVVAPNSADDDRPDAAATDTGRALTRTSIIGSALKLFRCVACCASERQSAEECPGTLEVSRHPCGAPETDGGPKKESPAGRNSGGASGVDRWGFFRPVQKPNRRRRLWFRLLAADCAGAPIARPAPLYAERGIAADAWTGRAGWVLQRSSRPDCLSPSS
jgi:hypothetical protein